MIDHDEDESVWHVPPFVWLTVGGALAFWVVAVAIIWRLVSR